MAGEKKVDLVGASRAPLPIQGSEARTSVPLDAGVRRTAETAASDRVFLNLEHVRGLADSTTFQVYVGPPERLAGSVALFGVRKASLADGEGLTFVLEITQIMDALPGSGSLDVRIVPAKPVPETAQVSIGRVSIFRQGSA